MPAVLFAGWSNLMEKQVFVVNHVLDTEGSKYVTLSLPKVLHIDILINRHKS